MGFFRWVGRTFFNVPAWMDTKRLGENAGFIADTAKNLFTVQKAKRKETFEHAVKRFGLTEADLKKIKTEYFRFFLLFGVMTLLLLTYAIYLFSNGLFRAGFFSTLLMLLAATYTFRYHFWYYQIKQRQLGCTVRQWFYQGVLGIK